MKEEMGRWVKFCKNKVDRIEKIWNRKLEEGSTGEDDSNHSKDSDDNEWSHEDTIERLLAQDTSNRLSRSHVVENRSNDATAQDLLEAKASAVQQISKDDNDLGAILQTLSIVADG